MSCTALPTVATLMQGEDVFARCQGEKVVYHQRSAGLLLPPSLFMRLIMAEGDGVRKIASKGALTKHHPRDSKFMEKEQLKVCTKTPGQNFQNILCIKPVWHRLMMLEGLDEARGGCEGAGGGQKLQSHYWPWICLLSPIAGLPLASSIDSLSGAVRSGKQRLTHCMYCTYVCIHVFLLLYGNILVLSDTIIVRTFWLVTTPSKGCLSVMTWLGLG